MADYVLRRVDLVEAGKYEVTLVGSLSSSEVAALFLKTSVSDKVIPDFGVITKPLPDGETLPESDK